MTNREYIDSIIDIKRTGVCLSGKSQVEMAEINCKSAIYHTKTNNCFAVLFQSSLFIATVITVVTLVVFIHVLWADFVMWDDDVSIYRNPNLGGLSLERLRWIFTDVDSMMRYNPLTLLSWSITYHFFGLNPFWYHFGNWLLHGLNAGLVFLVLRKLLILGFCRQGDTKPWNVDICAAISALVWSLHPLRVEVVAWANERTYCQSLFFLLISLWFYMRANEGNTTVVRRRFILAASVFSYVFSLLSHAIGAFLPVVLIVLDVYPLGRIGGSKSWFRTAEVRRVLLEKLPFIASALAVGLITVYIRLSSAGMWSKPIPLANFGLFERFMQAMYIWAYYIWRPWYPIKMAPVYTTLVFFNPSSLPFLASGLIVVVGTFELWCMRGRWPLGLALGVCYLALLVPVLGLFEHPHYSSDRYSLIVSLVWSVLLGAWIASPKTRRGHRSVILVISIVIITALGVLTFRQTRIWDNSITLFKHTIQNLGDDPYRQDIHWRLGKFYMQQGDTTKAIEQIQRTLEINPYHSMSNLLLTQILTQQGKIDAAVGHLKEILKTRPNDLQAINNLAWLLAVYKDAQCHNPEMAIRLGKQACELTNYRNPMTFKVLAAAYAAAGRFPAAIAAAENAVRLAQLSGQQKQVKEAQYFLRLYKSGQPYIMPLPKASSD